MTKEELEKEAEDYAFAHWADTDEKGDYFADDVIIKQTYIVSAEPREKRIAELINLIHAERKRQEQCDDIHLKKIAELEKENAELKADNDARKFAMAMSEKVEKQLREENAKLKTDYEVLSCSVGDFGELQDKLEEEQRKNNGLSDNLTKAKELLKWFVWYFREGSPNLVPYKHKVEEAEQFLNEVEK